MLAKEEGNNSLVELQLDITKTDGITQVWSAPKKRLLDEQIAPQSAKNLREILNANPEDAVDQTHGDELLQALQVGVPELDAEWSKALSHTPQQWIFLPQDEHDPELSRAVVITEEGPRGTNKQTEHGLEIMLRRWEGIGWAVEGVIPILVSRPIDTASNITELISEARFAQELEDSGLVPLVRYIRDSRDQMSLIVTARASGDLLSQVPSFALQDRFRVAKNFIDKLASFHESGEVGLQRRSHGDVKPENAVVQIAYDGSRKIPTSVHLIDFGTAVTQSDWSNCCTALAVLLQQWGLYSKEYSDDDKRSVIADIYQRLEQVERPLLGTGKYRSPEAFKLLTAVRLSYSSLKVDMSERQTSDTNNILEKLEKQLTTPIDLCKSDAWSVGVSLVCCMDPKAAARVHVGGKGVSETKWHEVINEIRRQPWYDDEKPLIHALADVATGLIQTNPEDRISLEAASARLSTVMLTSDSNIGIQAAEAKLSAFIKDKKMRCSLGVKLMLIFCSFTIIGALLWFSVARRSDLQEKVTELRRTNPKMTQNEAIDRVIDQFMRDKAFRLSRDALNTLKQTVAKSD